MYMSSDGKSLEFVRNMLERKHLSKLKSVLEVSYYQESWGGGGGGNCVSLYVWEWGIE